MRLLALLYNFPPAVGPDVSRTYGLTKYLNESDVCVDVITTVPHWRRGTARWDADLTPYRRIIRLFDFDPSVAANARIAATQDVSAKRLMRRGVNLLKQLVLPDKAALWALTACFVALARHVRIRYDVVFTSYFPGSSAGVAVLLKLFFPRIIWIADFRDSWTMDLTVHRSAFNRVVNRALEKATILTSDRCVFINETMRRRFLDRYPGAQFKTAVIPNGYFAAETDSVKASSKQTPPVVLHTGTLSETRTVDMVLAANNLLERSHFVLRSVGVFYSELSHSAITAAESSGALEIVSFVPRNELRRHYEEASVLLVVINRVPSAREITTGKLFHYLAIPRPILVVGPTDGEAAAVVRNARRGLACHWDDHSCIARAIQELSKVDPADLAQPPPEYRFDRLSSALTELIQR